MLCHVILCGNPAGFIAIAYDEPGLYLLVCDECAYAASKLGADIKTIKRSA